jgi:cytidine deaminase
MAGSTARLTLALRLHSERPGIGVAKEIFLTPDELLAAARESASHAVVPYSHFPVGAAVETQDGRVFHGCNVESASYGLTMCAERVAIFAARSAGAIPTAISVTCVRGNPNEPSSLTPCGACRQVMMDQMGPDARCFIDGVGIFTVAELLPMGFRLPPSGATSPE